MAPHSGLPGASVRLPSLSDRDPGGGGWEAPGSWIGKKGGEEEEQELGG